MVGMREEVVSEAGIPYVLGRALFVRNARSQIAGTTHGMLKLVVRKDDRRLLGVHVIGDEAAELVHIGQAVMHAEGGTVDRFLHTTFNIPTRSEAYKYAAYDALQKLNGRPRTITPLSAELTQ
jgi:NAD(P) transhydrogenase